MRRSVLTLGILVCAVALGPRALRAQSQTSFGQYLVVLDDSGSMDQSDPRRLVVLASLALGASLEDGDQILLAGLGELARGATERLAFRSPRELLPNRDAAQREQLLRSQNIAELSAHGGQTPCAAALETARILLERAASAGAPQTLLLLTDGACNGRVAPAERWLGGLRAYREGRFRFALLVREGQRASRQLRRYAEHTGWLRDPRVAFDARSLTRAFAEVLSFSRGLRYDAGGRVGLERAFAGARRVRVLAIRAGSEGGALDLERVTEGEGAVLLSRGPTFVGEPGWRFRVAVTEPQDTPFAVRSSSSGAEVLVVPVYGRLRLEAVVAPCGDPPEPPWTTERALRAGQPACAWARLVGDRGETIHPVRSFEFGLRLCREGADADAGDLALCEGTPMQPAPDGTFHAILGDVPLGRHQRRFVAHGGALAFPVVAERGFAAMAFGLRHVAYAETPERPLRTVDLGTRPRGEGELSLRVRGAFPEGARAHVGCEIEDSQAGACLRCAPSTAELELTDGAAFQLEVRATPFCPAAQLRGSATGPLEVEGALVITPQGDASELGVHRVPVRAQLRYPRAEALEASIVGGEERTLTIGVPAPAWRSEVTAEALIAEGGLEARAMGPARWEPEPSPDGTQLGIHLRADECCREGTRALSLRLTAAEGPALEVPLEITVRDPGFWVCPGRAILRWGGLVLGLLLLLWIVRGVLSPARFRDGAILANARSHEQLMKLREGDEGYRELARFSEAKRGFRRPGAIWLGGPRAPLPSMKAMPPEGRIEARPGGGATLVVTGGGVERFTESEGWQELSAGEYVVANRVVLRRGDEVYLEFRR